MTTATTIWPSLPPSPRLLLFALSSMAILALPGPTMLYVVSRTLEHGRAAGLLSVLGVEVGALAHVAAAAAGLSAVLASSTTAMTGLQLTGAAYLLHLGLGRLRSACEWNDEPARARHGRTLFWQDVLVDALNPKTAIFFLAFLPQFVDPDRGASALQVAALGLCFVALATLSDGACALAAGVLHRRLSDTAAGQRGLNRIAAHRYWHWRSPPGSRVRCSVVTSDGGRPPDARDGRPARDAPRAVWGAPRRCPSGRREPRGRGCDRRDPGQPARRARRPIACRSAARGGDAARQTAHRRRVRVRHRGRALPPAQRSTEGSGRDGPAG